MSIAQMQPTTTRAEQLSQIVEALDLPLTPLNGKAPTLKGWQSEQHSKDPEQLTKWAETTSNFGVVLGPDDIVLDFDNTDSYDAAIASYPVLRFAFTTRTPKGYHVYLKFKETQEPFSQSVRVLEDAFPGMDTRTKGGQCVAPGSAVNGITYEAVYGLERRPTVHLPEPLYSVLKPRRASLDRSPVPVDPATAQSRTERVLSVQPLSDYARTALTQECAIIERALPGTRHDTLLRASFKIGNLVGGSELSYEHAYEALSDAAQRMDTYEYPPKAIIRDIEDGLAAGMESPRTSSAPAKQSMEQPRPLIAETGHYLYPRNPDGTIDISRVETIPRTFKWDTRLVEGEITVVAGETGIGKSFVTCAIAAEFTQRGEHVLIVSYEDDPDIIVKRLRDMGADENFIVLPHPSMFRELSDDPRELETLIARYSVKLVIFDPLNELIRKTDRTSRADVNSNSDVRDAMEPLLKMAKMHQLPVVITHHLSKGTNFGSSIEKIMGAGSITHRARSVVLVYQDHNLGKKVVGHIKSSYEKPSESLSYDITDDGAFIWKGSVDSNPDQPDAIFQDNDAQMFLRKELSNGPQAKADLEERALTKRISTGQLRRAAKKLHVVMERESAKHGRSEWRLPTPDEIPEGGTDDDAY